MSFIRTREVPEYATDTTDLLSTGEEILSSEELALHGGEFLHFAKSQEEKDVIDTTHNAINSLSTQIDITTPDGAPDPRQDAMSYAQRYQHQRNQRVLQR